MNISSREVSTDFIPDWRTQADCKRVAAPDWWFPKGETSAADIMQAADAKAICRSCPVAMTCALWALDKRPSDGIFGGLDVTQRRILNRRAADGDLTDAEIADQVQATWTKDALGPLVDAFLDRTIQRTAGHVVWRGRKTTYNVAGRVFTPAQLAFEVGYGRRPEGHVKATCGVPYCVAPEHLADGQMRWRRDRLASVA
ncbi:WhiB family transcriptional regulator [Streptomyces sp. NPDC014779]|uniref:WhiB family transcriptional regulator n=1 Tax=Streptomyces sp. NPDC014779 TaxID=3364911 RepID=UPI0036FF773E